MAIAMASKPLSPSAEEFIPSAAARSHHVVHYFAPSPFTVKQYFPVQPLHYYYQYPYNITSCYFMIKTPTSNVSLFSDRQQFNSQPPAVSRYVRKETPYVDVDGGGYTYKSNTNNNKSFGYKFGRNKFPSRFRRSNQIFVPKPMKNKLSNLKSNPNPNPKPKPEITDENYLNVGKTTLMIRNIPNQLRRHDFLQFLKMHCQNQKSESESQDSVEIDFDFLYLPMDFRKHKNLGYAFVNWTSEAAAVLVWEMLNDWKWSSMYPSEKICKIDWGRIQGKDALVSRFTNTCFECVESEYLPIVVIEDGNSEMKDFITVGRCVPPSGRARFKGRF